MLSTLKGLGRRPRGVGDPGRRLRKFGVRKRMKPKTPIHRYSNWVAGFVEGAIVLPTLRKVNYTGIDPK